MRRALLLIACSCFAFGAAHAQLTGTRNIPGDYATLDLAITDLNTQGVGVGGVTLNVVAGNPQTAPAGGYVITAQGTVANMIAISGNANLITASGAHTAGALNDAIFKIVGGDFITISGFVMAENVANIDMTPGTNTMTEWGVALLYASTTNGAQFNNVVGNTISLNRAYTNTWGVYSNVRHSATAPTTTADITSPAGSNSGNKVWGNTINNVNMGIAFIGSSNAANHDAGNDVGGTMALTGNVITNWGGAAAGSSYISNSGTSYCIFMNHQTGLNVSYNTITSAAVTTTTTFRGIVQDYTAGAPTGTFTNTISNNTITMSNTSASGTFRCIDASGGSATATLNITNNTIQNCAIGGSPSSSLLGGIFNAGAMGTLNISNNILQGNTSSATTGGFTAISNTGAVVSTITISNNQIGTASGNAITYNSATSGATGGILNTNAAAGCTLNIVGNDIRGIVHNVAGSSTHTYYNNSSGNPHTNINNNTFTNLNVNTTGGVTFIGNNVTHIANTVHNVNNNSIVTAFNKGGAGGTVYFYNSFSTSLTAVTETNTGNNFSNLTFTGATTISGWRCGDGSTSAPYGPNKIVTNNTFSNITCGTSAAAILEVDYSNSNSTTNNVSGNVISNISGGGALTGILTNQGNQNFFNNTISGLSSTGAAAVLGISVTGGATNNINNNKIYDLQASNLAGTASGIRVSGGVAATVTNIFNNLVGDIRTPTADAANPLTGISVTATAAGETINMYHNTIHLNATSFGINFGSSGISVTTGPTVDLRNNLVVNLSAANGTGLAVAYRRSSATLGTYANTSNNNSFYAGTPSATHLIFTDGTNSHQTLAAYQAFVAPRDANSYTENPTFASLAGSSPSFLHIPAATPTFLESRGSVIGSITTDYDGDARPGPVGSVNGGATAPDIGADEFDGIPGCAGTPTAGLASGTPGTQCGSGSFTLTLTGSSPEFGIAYQWQESTTAGGPYTNIPGATGTTYNTPVLPAGTAMYYVALVTCTGSGLSATSNEVSAVVYANPTVNASATSSAVCAGDSVMLTGSGASTYVWTGGVTNGVNFAPASTDTYTVTGTDANGCTDTATVMVTVNPLPTVGATATDSTICAGDSIMFMGTGASTYAWSGGVTDGMNFAPAATNTYTVTGTDANGCMDTATLMITVNTVPVVTLSGNNAFCAGDSTLLTGSSGGTSQWYLNGAPISGANSNTYYATMAGIYNMTKTNLNGCMDSSSVGITVTVNALPTVTVSLPYDTVCLTGGSLVLSGQSPMGGTWSGNGVTDTIFDPTAAGLGVHAIMYMYTDSNGCSGMSTDSLLVDACTNIVTAQLSGGVNVYPNPSSGVLNIELSFVPASPVKVELLNELGQLVDAFMMSDVRRQVDLTSLEGGMYVLRVIEGNKVSLHKIVKQ